MKSVRIENAQVIDPSTGRFEPGSLTVREGRISFDSKSVDATFDARGRWLTPGLVDLRSWPAGAVDFTQALAAGVTTVCLSPEARVRDARLHVFQAAALVRGADGSELGEIAEGTRCMSTGFSAVPRAGVFRRALQYARPFDLPLLVHAEVTSLSGQGVLAEGAVATRLGLTGVPPSAETAAVAQLLEIIREIGARVHFSHLTCARSVALVTAARADGVNVTCDVTVQHLTCDDSTAEGFSLDARVWPPLRSAADVRGLQKALKTGLIDAVSFDHVAVSSIDREHAFAQSAPGRSAWAMGIGPLLRLGLTPVELVALVTSKPAALLGLREAGSLRAGAPADLCLLDPQTGMSALTMVAGQIQHQRPLE